MFRSPKEPLVLLALCAASCSSNRHIVQTGERTYRLRCETSLGKCLELAEQPCHAGFDLLSGRDVRQEVGVDAVGTGPGETRTSEAVIRCRSNAVFAGEDEPVGSEVRLERQPVCTPGSSQACVGPGGCAGGQSCLGDGLGYAPCDCGASPPTASSAAPSSNEADVAPEPNPVAAPSATGATSESSAAVAPSGSAPVPTPTAAPSAPPQQP